MTSRIRRNSLIPSIASASSPHQLVADIEEPQARQRRGSVSFFTPPQISVPDLHVPDLQVPVTQVPNVEPIREGHKSLCERVSRNEKRLDENKSCECDKVEAKCKSDIDQLKKQYDITLKKLYDEVTVLRKELKDLIDN